MDTEELTTDRHTLLQVLHMVASSCEQIQLDTLDGGVRMVVFEIRERGGRTEVVGFRADGRCGVTVDLERVTGFAL